MTHDARRLKSVFREFQPAEQVVADHCGDIIRRHFELAAAVPLRTSALELRHTLLASSVGAKVVQQIYTVNEPSEAEAAGDPKFALRYDLTVPSMRYITQHADTLDYPLRRYQIQPVWRCEGGRAGSFSEFVQCDIDVVGDGTLDIMTDAEMVMIINDIFEEMAVGQFQVRISNRKLLEAFLSWVGLADEMLAVAIAIIDGMDALGLKRLKQEIQEKLSFDASQADRVVRFISLRGSADDILSQLSAIEPGLASEPQFQRGIEEIRGVTNGARLLGVPEKNFVVDLSVARGLTYYTGSIFETMLLKHPGLGSICSGGRYDDLANLFTDRKLPGVGVSIGLTRLVSRLLEAGVLKIGASTKAIALVTSQDRDALDQYLKVGVRLRRAGIGTEIYLEDHALGRQLHYAKKKGFRYALRANQAQLAAKTWRVKNLTTGETTSVADDNLETWLAEIPDPADGELAGGGNSPEKNQVQALG
jgi:histidyl-tRNA synthetase